jgi:hypothetical protein
VSPDSVWTELRISQSNAVCDRPATHVLIVDSGPNVAVR